MGLLMLAVLPVLAQKQKPATVIITAGQSNTDGQDAQRTKEVLSELERGGGLCAPILGGKYWLIP